MRAFDAEIIELVAETRKLVSEERRRDHALMPLMVAASSFAAAAAVIGATIAATKVFL